VWRWSWSGTGHNARTRSSSSTWDWISAPRAIVLKSRGHFRGGFDEFFRNEQVVEVDAPGLTSPILTCFDWRHLPRPVLPIDPMANWSLR